MKVCICHGFKINQKIISGNSPLDLDADAGRSLPVRRQAQQVQQAPQERPVQQELLVQREPLLRQYMHNTEIAVTMRLSTILKTIKQPL